MTPQQSRLSSCYGRTTDMYYLRVFLQYIFRYIFIFLKLNFKENNTIEINVIFFGLIDTNC
jgi:hypothetical protein